MGMVVRVMIGMECSIMVEIVREEEEGVVVGLQGLEDLEGIMTCGMAQIDMIKDGVAEDDPGSHDILTSLLYLFSYL